MMPATSPIPDGNGQTPAASGDEFGRVLRASTTGFAVGSRVAQLEAPSFGCMVKAQPVDEREAIYGLIYDMNIDDDPLIRRLILAENPRQSVIEDQRRNRLVPIEMSVLTVGYRRNGDFYHGLPPRPPLNLDPVHLCTDSNEVVQFTDRPDYLRLILRTAGGNVPIDQLLVAHILQTYEMRGEDAAWARQMISEIAVLLRGDYELLTAVLETMSHVLPALPEIAELLGY
jgi:hypothetical protein